MSDHPLDRPVWNALTTRQADLALGDRHAVRFRPSVNLFAARADQTPASLEALGDFAARLSDGATMGLVEAAPHAAVPGTTIVSAKPLDQMVLSRLDARHRPVTYVALGSGDVPAMLALTALTVPGPFFAETYLQGGYIGVYEAGKLIAMAGQRMRPPGFTEVSAVCTHPDYQGRGLGRALMEAVIAPILAQGEAAFLHCYPDNPARGLYEALGFRYRATMTYTVLSRSKRFSRGAGLTTAKEGVMNFSKQRMDGTEFRDCSLKNAVFDDVNLGGATLTNVNLAEAKFSDVNLSGVTIENANITGMKIFGYDVETWIKEQLAKDACHLD